MKGDSLEVSNDTSMYNPQRIPLSYVNFNHVTKNSHSASLSDLS